MYKVSMVSLGCPKNQVDAEQMLYTLQTAGFELTPAEAEADAIIINTCGFIESAKAEAIENILEAAKYKDEGNCKALIVTGCLAERYRNSILEEFPEVDAVLGVGSIHNIVEAIEAGCDVIASDRPFVHAICCASELFEPSSASSIADAVIRYEQQKMRETRLLVRDMIEELITRISAMKNVL